MILRPSIYLLQTSPIANNYRFGFSYVGNLNWTLIIAITIGALLGQIFGVHSLWIGFTGLSCASCSLLAFLFKIRKSPSYGVVLAACCAYVIGVTLVLLFTMHHLVDLSQAALPDLAVLLTLTFVMPLIS